MSNAKYPLSSMPAFTREQLNWLRGYFYEELTDPETSPQQFAGVIGTNRVVTTIENQMEKLAQKCQQFNINHKGV